MCLSYFIVICALDLVQDKSMMKVSGYVEFKEISRAKYNCIGQQRQEGLLTIGCGHIVLFVSSVYTPLLSSVLKCQMSWQYYEYLV